VGGKVHCVTVGGVAVEGVDGSEDAKHWSDGEMGTMFRRMKSGVGASFERLCFASVKEGRDKGKLSFDDGSDVRDVEGDSIG
jgi:hypothetical protein